MVYDAVDREHGIRVALKTLRTLDPEASSASRTSSARVAGPRAPEPGPARRARAADGPLVLHDGARRRRRLPRRGRAAARSPTPQDVEPRPATSRADGAGDATRRGEPARMRRGAAVATASLPALDVPALRDALAPARPRACARCTTPGSSTATSSRPTCWSTRDGPRRAPRLRPGPPISIRAASSTASRPDRGTVAYMAPEQAPAAQVGEAADWYAVGVMLYEALTGALPHGGHALQILVREAARRAAPAARSSSPGVPARSDELCRRAAATRPGRPRPSGAELARAPRAATTTRRRAVDAQRVARRLRRPRRASCDALAAAFAGARAGAPRRASSSPASRASARARSFARFARPRGARAGALVLTRPLLRARERCRTRRSTASSTRSRRCLAALPDAGGRRAPAARRPALLVRVFPVLRRASTAIAQRAGAAPSGGRAARAAPRARSRAARAARRGSPSARRLVLAIDDLQWADADSLVLLLELLAAPPRGLLVAASFRADEAARDPALAPYLDAAGSGRAGRAAELVTVDLGALAMVAAEELATATLGPSAWTPTSARGRRSPGGGRAPVLRRGAGLLRGAPAARGGRGGARRAWRSRRSSRTACNSWPTPSDRWSRRSRSRTIPFPSRCRSPSRASSRAALRALWSLRGSHFVHSTGAGADDRIELHHDRMRESVLGTCRPNESTSITSPSAEPSPREPRRRERIPPGSSTPSAT